MTKKQEKILVVDDGQEKILVIDDEEVIRILLKQRLSLEGYECHEASNGEQALDKLANNAIDLVILDIMMPGRSGVDLLYDIKHTYPDIAVIMATAVSDTATAINCIREGAYDYVVKPFNANEVAIIVERALEKRRLELENRTYQEHLERMVEERTRELRQAINKIKLASLDTIQRLARAAEYRDEDTGAHIQRMSLYSAGIARKMGLGYVEVENILYAAPMHDVGKIGIPDSILLKPSKLDPDEWETMKKHTIIGAELLRGSEAPFTRLAEVIALTHHEKWDGSGYPQGLRGKGIPLAGRIVAIADVFDALTSARPYKEPFSIAKALRILLHERGNHFDPDVVDAFFAVKDEMLSIREEHKDQQGSQLIRMATGIQRART